MSGTIRSRMEAQRDRHPNTPSRIYRDQRDLSSIEPEPWCERCEESWPCPDRVAADDTLTDLDNARCDVLSLSGYEGVVRCRSIPDPEETHGRRPDRVDG